MGRRCQNVDELVTVDDVAVGVHHDHAVAVPVKGDARIAEISAASILAKVSRGLGAPMTGIGMDEINQRYAERGW